MCIKASILKKFIPGIIILSLINNDAIAQQTPHLFSFGIIKKTRIHYLLYLPEKYDVVNTSWPLMIFLHGMGERGTNLDLVKKNGPPMLIEKGEQFPFIILSPQCPEGQEWSAYELTKLVRYAIKTYKVDRSRIYLTGLSMGGRGTWDLACSHPDYFAAIVPVCGVGDPSKAGRLKDVPVWVFHGARDDVVPLIKSKVMVNALKNNGVNVKFTIYTDSGHDAWTETYSDPRLYEWLLEQHR
jgi:predicted peptidase